MDGYKKADGMSEEYVYITAGGEVYHTDSKCTHLLRYIKKCDKCDIEEIRNNSGSKYYECKMCKKIQMTKKQIIKKQEIQRQTVCIIQNMEHVFIITVCAQS